MKHKIHVGNLKRLKLLALTGMVLVKSDVTTLASSLDKNMEDEYEIRGELKYLGELYDDESEELNISIEEWGNPLFVDRLKSDLSHLNKGFLKFFEDIGFRIIVLDGPKSAEDRYYQEFGIYYNSIRGFPFENYDGIYIESTIMPGYYEKYSDSSKGLTEEEFNYILVRDTLYHEMAHCIDGGFNQYISGCDEFQSIYSQEVQNYMNTTEYKVENLEVYTNISTSVEYFATAFACYLIYPDSLKDNCPLTYQFYDRFMDELMINYGVSNSKNR